MYVNSRGRAAITACYTESDEVRGGVCFLDYERGRRRRGCNFQAVFALYSYFGRAVRGYRMYRVMYYGVVGLENIVLVFFFFFFFFFLRVCIRSVNGLRNRWMHEV